MKRLLYFLLLPLLAVACSGDEQPVAPHAPGPLRLEVPISVMTASGTADVRATRVGDPGLTEEMPMPRHIYVFAWVRKNETDCQFACMHREVGDEDWEIQDAGSEYTERYTLRNPLTLPEFSVDEGVFAQDEMIGRTFAIATIREIDKDTLSTMLTTICVTTKENEVHSNMKTTEDYTTIDERIKALVLDCTGWSSNDLRDLYSTPKQHDGRVDGLSIRNGQIVYNTEDYEDRTVLHGDVRLYHVAAKIDFKWEVPASLQDVTAVSKIKVTQLPTSCKVFDPTQNDAGTHTHELPTDPGSKWIGRQYCYALQPHGGTISYTVDFEGVNGSTPKASVSTGFTPGALSDIFTGWFRINATIKE